MKKLFPTSSSSIKKVAGSGAIRLKRHLFKSGVSSSRTNRFLGEVKKIATEQRRRYGRDFTAKEMHMVIKNLGRKSGDSINAKDARIIEKAIFGEKK
jgi:hypothetical protein